LRPLEADFALFETYFVHYEPNGNVKNLILVTRHPWMKRRETRAFNFGDVRSYHKYRFFVTIVDSCVAVASMLTERIGFKFE
jgi:hypothetical protein